MPIRRAVGVLGTVERAEVDDRGAVSACDGAWRLDWSVVEASGKWRNPATDTSTRQVAVSSTPVFETSVRVAGGDIRHRVYGIYESGALAIVEVENDSPEPVAVAFAFDGDSPPLVSPRAAPVVPAMPAPVGPPADATLFALPHRGVIRVGVPLGDARARWPDRVPAAAQVAAGWTLMAERCERVEGPGSLPGRFAFARAQLLLGSGSDPAELLLAAGARWRLARESIDVPLADIGTAAQLVAQRVRSGATSLEHAALVEARALLAASGDPRGAGDVEHVLDRLSPASGERESESHGGVVAAIRGELVSSVGADSRTLLLLPGLASEWRGADVAVHRVPTRWGEISFAIRWHGTRPALLWELDSPSGSPITLRVPHLDFAWSSAAPSGEALLSGVSAT